jgi:hypothetical protein
LTNENEKNEVPEIDKEKIETVKNEFNEEKIKKEKPKTKSTYRTKKQIAEEEKQEKEQFIKSISNVGSFGMDLLIKRLPNPVPLSELETEQIDGLFSKVAYKYSSLLGDYQEETALFVVCSMVLLPRLKQDKKENELKTEK